MQRSYDSDSDSDLALSDIEAPAPGTDDADDAEIEDDLDFSDTDDESDAAYDSEASDLHLNIAASSPIQTSAASDSADVRLLTSAAAAAVDNRPDSGVALGGGSNTKPASACSQRDAAAAAATAKALGAVPQISVMDNTLELGAPGAGASAQKHHAPPADGDVATRADSATATASESSGSRPTLRATGRLERSLTMVGAGGGDDLSDAGSDGSIGSYLEDTDDGSRDPDTTEEEDEIADEVGLTIAEQLNDMSDDDHDTDSVSSGGGTPFSSGAPLTMSQLDRKTTTAMPIVVAAAAVTAAAPTPHPPAIPVPVSPQQQNQQQATAGLGLSETLPWSPAAKEATDDVADHSAPLPSPSMPPPSPPSAMKETVPWTTGVESSGPAPAPTSPPTCLAPGEPGPVTLPPSPAMPPIGASSMALSNMAATTFGDPEEDEDEDTFSPFGEPGSPERPLAATIVPSTTPRRQQHKQSAASPTLTPSSRKRWRHHPPPLPYLGMPLFPKALAVDPKMATVPELTYSQLEALRPMFSGNAQAEPSAGLSLTDGTWIASEYLRLGCYDEALAVLESAASATASPAAAASLETVRGFVFAGLRNLARAVQSFDAAILKRAEHLQQAGAGPDHAAGDVDSLELLLNRAICHVQLHQPLAVIVALTPALDELAAVAPESTTTELLCARGTARYLVGRAHLDVAMSGEPHRATNADRAVAVRILQLALEDAKVLLVARSAGPIQLHGGGTRRSLADSVMHPAVRKQLDEAMAVIHLHIGSAFMLVGDRNVHEAAQMFGIARVLLNGPDTVTLALEGRGLISVNEGQSDQVDPLLNLILVVQTAYTLAETVRYEQVPELGRSVLPEILRFFGVSAHRTPQSNAGVAFYKVHEQLRDLLYKVEQADGLGGRL